MPGRQARTASPATGTKEQSKLNTGETPDVQEDHSSQHHYHRGGGSYGSLAPGFSRLLDANGLKYAIVFPEDIRLYGLSVSSRPASATRLYGDLAYRPNQPLTLNPSDQIDAFLRRLPTSALNLARNVNALPPGAQFDAYDRYATTSLILGFEQGLPGIADAERLLLAGELGWSHVAGLPGPGVLRYGRSDDYGLAAIDGLPCIDNTPAQKSCAHDGFVTRNAWGWRLRLAAVYPGAFAGATLTPSLLLAHDVRGYSHDGVHVEGRRILRPGLRAEWGKRYFAELNYTRLSGGAYHLQADRDHLTLFVGMRL